MSVSSLLDIERNWQYIIKNCELSVNKYSKTCLRNVMLGTFEMYCQFTGFPIVKRVSGFVRVLENLESHGNLKFQNPGLENLENTFWSLKVLEN